MKTFATALAIIWMFAGMAHANDLKGIDMTQIVTVDGKLLKDSATHDPGDWKLITDGPRAGERVDLDPNCERCKPLTLGNLLATTLKTFRPVEQNIVTGSMRESWSAFADKIKDDNDAKLTPKQIVLLNERIEAIITSGEVIRIVKKMIDPGYEPKLPD